MVYIMYDKSEEFGGQLPRGDAFMHGSEEGRDTDRYKRRKEGSCNL